MRAASLPPSVQLDQVPLAKSSKKISSHEAGAGARVMAGVGPAVGLVEGADEGDPLTAMTGEEEGAGVGIVLGTPLGDAEETIEG